MRILAIGTHPDDPEIFAFGTLALWAATGATPSLAVATDGAWGETRPPEEMRRLRAAETMAALAPLWAGAPQMLGFSDAARHADAGP
jgi:LmbE family N-acetylglucosaminyl deacetylase